MKLDFRQKMFFVLAVFIFLFTALLFPLITGTEKEFILLPIILITFFGFILYKILPGEKK